MKCQCPNCGHEYQARLTASVAGGHLMEMKLSPGEGRTLSPMHVGGVLRSFERLLVSMGRDSGFATRVGVQRLTTEEDGTVHLVAFIAHDKDTKP